MKSSNSKLQKKLEYIKNHFVTTSLKSIPIDKDLEKYFNYNFSDIDFKKIKIPEKKKLYDDETKIDRLIKRIEEIQNQKVELKENEVFKKNPELEKQLNLLQNEKQQYDKILYLKSGKKDINMKNKKINIAIDGPSGVGKTCMAKMLAEKLNYRFISSGIFYRIYAYVCVQKKLDHSNEEQVSKALDFDDIKIADNDDIFLACKNISKDIRDEKISTIASHIAKFNSIRVKINQYIQKFSAEHKGIIVDGRDATYRILPDAEAKFFMWASPEIRANRRWKQNLALGINSNYEKILEQIKDRDFNDINREIDPLIVSPGSIQVNTDNMSIEENFKVLYDKILDIINEVNNE
ncbi:(d)CMP kinase [Metamycoplasma hyosynoviae]|uniref:Cytidylate kinase n=1 Tax=Metamycoplasma hyosynoviae TaxID=29559 RepID=A0A9Q9F2G0_9BACT|nr:(d)CMP kinase [Metamycoplasma hyosynoviae]MDD1358753.1 (d)CMP kinase [Metamycoplasma hyosynoviae]MDD1361432.1 (d)CMP kinase [Metamycoplasma hyosynoviae]MDD1373812.1 (d)CMP kinase [Metamycoplasma hyosynoviae]MDD1375844.1 (d)CMP kinase [Metamycoplasma hyosynoviae]MDD1376269.1 (d)CMP kinase [Metamycoplasma hyosynoviae]